MALPKIDNNDFTENYRGDHSEKNRELPIAKMPLPKIDNNNFTKNCRGDHSEKNRY